MRIGLTDGERERFVPGRGVVTDGVKRLTTRHMNLSRSLSDVYDIRHFDKKRKVGWVWINRDTGRAD